MTMPKFAQARMGLYNTLIYLPYGVLLPFLGLWLFAYGWSPVQISFIVASSFLFSLVVDPIVGVIADRSQAFRLVLFVLSLLSTIFWYVGTLKMDDFWWVLIFYTLFRLLWIAIIPVADNLGFALAQASRRGNWGIIRSLGSLGFIIAAQVTAYVTDGAEDWTTIMIQLVTITMIILIIGSLLIPKYKLSSHQEASISKLSLLSKPVMALFVIGSLLIAESHGLEIFLGNLRWQSIGFTNIDIANLWTMRVGAEVMALIGFGYLLRSQDNFKVIGILLMVATSAFFISFISSWLGAPAWVSDISSSLIYGAIIVAAAVFILHFIRGNVTAKDLILVAAIASIIRWLILAYTHNMQLIFIGESLHALSYGGLIIASIAWVRSYLPSNITTTGMGLINGASALGYGLGSFFGGWKLGSNGDLWARAWSLDALTAVVALICFMLAFRLEKQNK